MRYADHLEFASTFNDLGRQLKWLRDAVDLFRGILSDIGMWITLALQAPDAAKQDLSSRPLVLKTDLHMSKLLEKEKKDVEVADLRKKLGLDGASSSSTSFNSNQLPLLSHHAPKPKGGPSPKKPKIDASAMQGLPPGSNAGLSKWANANKVLATSGLAWNIPALANHLGVAVEDHCWEFLLARVEERNRPSRCTKWGTHKHETATSSAHVVPGYPNGLPIDALATQFARPLTADERASMASAAASGPVFSQQRGKGGRGGRGRGGGRGRDSGRGRDGGRGRGRGERGRGARGRGRGRGRAGDANDDGEDVEVEAEIGASLTWGSAPPSPSREPAPAIAPEMLNGALSLDRLVLGDACSETILLGLKRPMLPVDRASPPHLLAPPLKTLARKLLPTQIVIDLGGSGQCAPNTISFLLGLVEITDMDGPQLRQAVVDHLQAPGVKDRLSSILERNAVEPLTLEQLVINCFSHWPSNVQSSAAPSIEAWSAAILHPETWTDLAFTQIVADLFSVAVSVTGVNDLSEIFALGIVGPCDGTTPVALIETGVWIARHMVAIVAVSPSAAAEPAATGSQDPPFNFPIRTLCEFKRLLASANPPTDLVGCEFSGAVRSARESLGRVAISVDVRECEIGGMHAILDVRQVVCLCWWEAVFLFPPCFQQLRADADCLQLKIDDGRAFWGCLFVIFCLFATTATMVLVEQPDTIVYDHMEWDSLNVDVTTFRTPMYGDAADKLVRIFSLNASLPPFAHSRRAAAPQPARSQFQYESPEHRDRARSSWRTLPRTAAAIAGATPKLPHKVAHLYYPACAHAFAQAWLRHTGDVPIGYNSPTAIPPTEDARRYQLERGPGDGRRVDAAFVVGHMDFDPDGDGALCPTGWSQGDEEGLLAMPRNLASMKRSRLARAGWRSATTQNPRADDFGDLLAARASDRAARQAARRVSFSTDEATTAGMAAYGRYSSESTEPDPGAVASALAAATNAMDRARPTEALSDSADLAFADTQSFDIPVHHCVSLADAVVAAHHCYALLWFVCVIAQPVVLAHVDGFTMAGISVPPSSRPMMSRAVAALCTAIAGVAQLSFMVGEYGKHLRLFVSPTEFRPRPESICRTPADRRKAKLAGAAFVWCTLAALQGAPALDLAQRAVLSVQMFVQPVASLPDAPIEGAPIFQFGVTRAQSLMPRPAPEMTSSAAGALQELQRAGEVLQEAILDAVASGDQLLFGWAEHIKPVDHSMVPPELLDERPDFSDTRLDRVRLSPDYQPLTTEWSPRPPRQPPSGEGAPACIESWRDIARPEAVERIDEFLELTRLDLSSIASQLEAGVPPDQVLRPHRPAPIAIGQTEVKPWAVGRVYDCTKRHDACCVPVDYSEELHTHLDLDYLRERIGHYSDRALVSYLLDGVRLEADVELQAVFVPHLTSLPMGWASIMRELERKTSLNWYELYSDLAFFPSYWNGRGAAARKLEPDRWRETTEGGGPRTLVVDASGLRAISINDASRVHHMPRHYVVAAAERPEFAAWLQARGLPRADEPLSKSPHRRYSKWPKEDKPTLLVVMRNTAIHNRAAAVIGVCVYGWGDDYKDHFNQLTMCISERPKMNHILLGPPDEHGHRPLLFVSERQLGFGMHPASNIAQRFSDLVLVLFRQDMDAAEEQQAHELTAAELRWLNSRLELQRRLGVPCVDIYHLTRSAEDRLPPIPPPASVAELPKGYVCPELRLYSAYVFTDDPQFVAVGVARTLRGLRCWRNLVLRLRVIMAIEAKRSVGAWCSWVGVILIFGLGLVVVSRNKLMRARAAIVDTLHGRSEFQAYRSLCGLLEHLRAVNLSTRQVMHGLYQPHAEQSLPGSGPNSLVEVNELMKAQLERWLQLLLRSNGVSCKRALFRRELEPAYSVFVDATSDACYADAAQPGVAGFCHGLYWLFVVPPADVQYLSIPILEFLGVLGNVLALYPYLEAICGWLGERAERAAVLLRTDALTTACTLPAESMRSALLVLAYRRLCESHSFQALKHLLSVGHVFGDGNPFSDLLSRQKWEEFHQLCNQCGVAPLRIDVPNEFFTIYNEIVALAKQRALHASAAGVGHNCFRVGCSPLDGAALARLRGEQVTHADPPQARGQLTAEVAHIYHSPPSSPGAALSRVIGSSSSSSSQQASKLRPGLTLPAAKCRRVSGACLPPELPPTRPESALVRAGRAMAARKALAFTQGEPGMAFDMPLDGLTTTAQAMEEAVSQSVPPGTASADDRAWEMWADVCADHGTDPLRTAEEAHQHPERNAHLLAVLMLKVFATAKPKSRSRQFVKPASALAYPLAIVRIFARWSISMPCYKMLKGHLNAMVQTYQEYHGPLSLCPVRVEPMKFSMVRSIHALEGIRIGVLWWSDDDHNVFMFRRLNCFLPVTAFRLGEICGQRKRVDHSGVPYVSKIHYLVFASCSYRLKNKYYKRLTLEQLDQFQFGRDQVAVATPLAKADQTGEIHCPFPVHLPYENDAINAAAAILDIERRYGVHLSDDEREITPLFHDGARQPFEHHFLHRMLRSVLRRLYGEKVAQLFSFHSYRAGLATALHAAGVDDAMIQLICRWMCPESLHRYRVVGLREHEMLTKRALNSSVASIQANNIPRISNNQGYASLLAELVQSNSPAARNLEKQFDAAALSPAAPSPPGDTSAPPPPPRAEVPSQTRRRASTLGAGDKVIVLPAAFPQETCAEMQHGGWRATVVRSRKRSCVVSFDNARTRDGRPYHPTSVPMGFLRDPEGGTAFYDSDNEVIRFTAADMWPALLQLRRQLQQIDIDREERLADEARTAWAEGRAVADVSDEAVRRHVIYYRTPLRHLALPLWSNWAEIAIAHERALLESPTRGLRFVEHDDVGKMYVFVPHGIVFTEPPRPIASMGGAGLLPGYAKIEVPYFSHEYDLLPTEPNLPLTWIPDLPDVAADPEAYWRRTIYAQVQAMRAAHVHWAQSKNIDPEVFFVAVRVVRLRLRFAFRVLRRALSRVVEWRAWHRREEELLAGPQTLFGVALALRRRG